MICANDISFEPFGRHVQSGVLFTRKFQLNVPVGMFNRSTIRHKRLTRMFHSNVGLECSTIRTLANLRRAQPAENDGSVARRCAGQIRSRRLYGGLVTSPMPTGTVCGRPNMETEYYLLNIIKIYI